MFWRSRRWLQILRRAYAGRHQLDVVAALDDKARSGASVFGRDGLMQLMDAAREDIERCPVNPANSKSSKTKLVSSDAFLQRVHFSHDGIGHSRMRWRYSVWQVARSSITRSHMA
jgi:hypothetical protein